MTERRSTYFIFQGLLTIILLLFYFYRRDQIEDWPIRLGVLTLLSGGLLGLLAMAPDRWLENSKAQGAWFVVDILLASVTLYWIQQPTSDLYLAYFLVIFGTAITHSMTQSFMVALLATILYSYLSWHTTREAPQEFWLRLPFLWIVASFTGILSRDTRENEEKQERTYRERLFHLERLAVLGQVAAEIAHRIKAPLTTIRVNAEVLAHQKDMPKKHLGELSRIETEVDHCKEVLQKLLTLGRIEELEMEAIDLMSIVRDMLKAHRMQLRREKISLHTQGLHGKSWVHGDPALLSEALSAILQNAIEAMPQGGQLHVKVRHQQGGGWWPSERARNRRVFVTIQDTGIGIEAEKLETIFRPFFTTKTNQGNGLGLSSALRIIDKHGGSIAVTSDGPGKGACFSLSLPEQSGSLQIPAPVATNTRSKQPALAA